MKTVFLSVLAGSACMLMLGTGVTWGEVTRHADLTRVEGAIVSQLRFQMYWWGREEEYRQGATLPLELASDGHLFVAKIDNFRLLPDGSREVAFMKGVQGEERTWILEFSATPVAIGEELFGGKDWWAKLQPKLEHPSIVRDVITVPADSTPSIEVGSPTKQRILETIIGSVQQQLHWNVTRRNAKLPPTVRFVLADFNVEDSTAFGFVEEEQDQVYEIHLYDPGDPSDPRYKTDPFLVWPVEREARERFLRQRIRRNSIAYNISLDLTPPTPRSSKNWQGVVTAYASIWTGQGPQGGISQDDQLAFAEAAYDQRFSSGGTSITTTSGGSASQQAAIEGPWGTW